jgi:hypothetical protein
MDTPISYVSVRSGKLTLLAFVAANETSIHRMIDRSSQEDIKRLRELPEQACANAIRAALLPRGGESQVTGSLREILLNSIKSDEVVAGVCQDGRVHVCTFKNQSHDIDIRF